MPSTTTTQTELWPQRPETYLRLCPQPVCKSETRALLDLPTELVILIVSSLPPSELGALRQTCRQLNTLASKRRFSHLTSFLSDSTTARRMLESASWDAMMETKSIWSPRCLAPRDLQVKESWLLAAYAGVEGESWCLRRQRAQADRNPTSLVTEEQEEGQVCEREILQSIVMAGLGRKLDEEELRLAFWQFCLYMSYRVPQGAVRSELPVISAALWR